MFFIIRLINSHFWKSFFGPFFAFGFTIIFIAILGIMLGYDQVLAGSLAIPAMAVGLSAMPQSVFEFKRSVLLKRISVSNIKPWMFLVSITSFYAIIMLISTFFCVAISIGIFSSNLSNGREIISLFPITNALPPSNFFAPNLITVLNNVDWGGFIWSVIMNILLSCAMGMFLVSVCKSVISIQLLGIPILIISQFLSAQVLPIGMVKEVDALWYMSYISPFKFTSSLIIESWNGTTTNAFISPITNQPVFGYAGANLIESAVNSHVNNYSVIISNNSIFDINSNVYWYSKTVETLKIFSQADKIANLVMPFVWIAIFGLISIKFFKWSGR